MDNKSKGTLFLERNEIWFKTVLSLAITIAAFCVSFASYRTAEHQAQLSALTQQNQDMEKQPYFIIENLFLEEDNEYTYLVRNTGGDVRYININLQPYLYVERKQNGVSKPLSYVFIDLPGLYRLSNIKLDEDTLFAFKDYIFEDENLSDKSLANELFLHYSSYDNLEGMNTSMYSQIIYDLQVTYVNYKNESKVDVITFSRSSDINEKTNGNTILSIDRSETFKKNDSSIYSVDSLNLSRENIHKQCEEIIINLRMEFGQTNSAEQYRNDRYKLPEAND